MDNRVISPMMMAHRLAVMLKPDAAEPDDLPEVRLTPRYNGMYGLASDACSVTFGLGGREVTVLYPAADLTLTLDEFAERHLTAAAKALA